MRVVSGGNARLGISCMVIDSLVCKQVMNTYRSDEDIKGNMPRGLRYERARRLAAEHCARLNAEAA